jgi:hypothetical protein
MNSLQYGCFSGTIVIEDDAEAGTGGHGCVIDLEVNGVHPEQTIDPDAA